MAIDIDLATFLPYLLRMASFGIVIFATLVVTRLSQRIVRRVFRSMPEMAGKGQNYVSLAIWFIGLILAVSQLGLAIEIFVLVLGLMGLAVILGMKDVLQNILAKPFLEMYDQLKIARACGNTNRCSLFNNVLFSC